MKTRAPGSDWESGQLYPPGHSSETQEEYSLHDHVPVPDPGVEQGRTLSSDPGDESNNGAVTQERTEDEVDSLDDNNTQGAGPGGVTSAEKDLGRIGLEGNPGGNHRFGDYPGGGDQMSPGNNIPRKGDHKTPLKVYLGGLDLLYGDSEGLDTDWDIEGDVPPVEDQPTSLSSRVRGQRGVDLAGRSSVSVDSVENSSGFPASGEACHNDLNPIHKEARDFGPSGNTLKEVIDTRQFQPRGISGKTDTGSVSRKADQRDISGKADPQDISGKADPGNTFGKTNPKSASEKVDQLQNYFPLGLNVDFDLEELLSYMEDANLFGNPFPF